MISVIINTKDRRDYLARCLKSILRQTQPVSEFIIVDASEDARAVADSVLTVLAGCRARVVLAHTRAGNSHQRNLGINLLSAAARYVCFFDDDVVLFDDTIARYLQLFGRYPDVMAVQGVEVNRKSQHALGKITRRLFGISYEGRHWRRLCSGENINVINPAGEQYVGSFMVGLTCIRRQALDEFRFDEWFEGYAFLEDYDFSWRMAKKYRLLLSPAVRLVHYMADSPRRNSFSRRKTFMINKAYCFDKHDEKKWLRRCAYVWSLVGYLVLMCGKSMYRRDHGYLTGTIAGILEVACRRWQRRWP